jgi:hypothetical protein
MFTGIFVPSGIAACRELSHGDKLAYGALLRFAGRDGTCFPSMQALGAKLGVSSRQARAYAAALEGAQLIRRVKRFDQRGQKSNGFQFLWHHLLKDSLKNSSAGPRKDNAVLPRKDSSAEESQTKESHSEEVKTDLDCLLHFGNEIGPPAGTREPSKCKPYPNVRECLARYMQLRSDAKEYPTERVVVDIMDAAGTHDERDVIAALKYFYNERGLKPFTEHGPRSFAWFKTVLQDHFRKKRERESAANPSGYHEWEDRNQTRLSRTPPVPKLSGPNGKDGGATTYG